MPEWIGSVKSSPPSSSDVRPVSTCCAASTTKTVQSSQQRISRAAIRRWPRRGWTSSWPVTPPTIERSFCIGAVLSESRRCTIFWRFFVSAGRRSGAKCWASAASSASKPALCSAIASMKPITSAPESCTGWTRSERPSRTASSGSVDEPRAVRRRASSGSKVSSADGARDDVSGAPGEVNARTKPIARWTTT